MLHFKVLELYPILTALKMYMLTTETELTNDLSIIKPLVKPVIVMDYLLFDIELPGIIKVDYL